MLRLVWVLVCLLLVQSSALQASNRVPSSLLIRGGARDVSFKRMVKAFWLSLLDPSNEEDLKQSKAAPKKKARGLFFSSKPKGRSLT